MTDVMYWIAERSEYELWFTLWVLGLLAVGVITFAAQWLQAWFTKLVRGD